MNPFYKFTAEAGDEPTSAELLIYDVIGDWEALGEVSAKGFAQALSQLPSSVKRLDIHINSPGGSVFDAQGIYSRLADHRAQKFVYVDGLAASAASIIAMVGHKIYMRENANMMIHLPSALTVGNEDDHEKTIRALKSITGAMLNTYAKRTGLPRGDVRDMLAAETWFTAQEAVENGFADEVRGVIKAAAMIDSKRVVVNGVEFDLSRFRNIPAFTASTTTRKGDNMPQATKPKAEATAAPPETTTETEKPPATTTTTETEKPPTKPPTAPAAEPAAATEATDYDKGVSAERARIAALNKLDKPATHSIVVAAIAEGKTAADIAEACVNAMANAGTQAARHADSRQLDQVPPSGERTTDGNNDNDFGVMLTKAVARTLKARGKKSVLNGRN